MGHQTLYDFQAVIALAQQAGDAIMTVYQRGFSVDLKADNSPVTQADLAAHRIIVEGLQQLTLGVPVLSEEASIPAWEERQHWQRYWLIDPLDGTREFVKKNDEFTVNIALIDNGQPVWGVVYAPALGLLYHGGQATGRSEKGNRQHSETLSAAPVPSTDSGWRIMGSRSHRSQAFDDFISQFAEPSVIGLGSSLKICRIAEGLAHLYPRFGATSEWDTAAAHAILSAAGGRVIETATGKELAYNQKDSVINPDFIAAAAGYNASPHIPADPPTET